MRLGKHKQRVVYGFLYSMSLAFALTYFRNLPRRLIKTTYKELQQHPLRVAGIQEYGITTEKILEMQQQLRVEIICP